MLFRIGSFKRFFFWHLILPCEFIFLNYYFITSGTSIGLKTQVKAGIHPWAMFGGQNLQVGLGNPDPSQHTTVHSYWVAQIRGALSPVPWGTTQVSGHVQKQSEVLPTSTTKPKLNTKGPQKSSNLRTLRLSHIMNNLGHFSFPSPQPQHRAHTPVSGSQHSDAARFPKHSWSRSSFGEMGWALLCTGKDPAVIPAQRS